MRIRSPKDFWAGLIFIAIGGGFVLLAQQYRLGDMHRMGPAMFPTLVGALLAVLGVVIALRALAFLGEPVPRFYLRPIGVSVLAIVPSPSRRRNRCSTASPDRKAGTKSR